jgi:hypothetical protein
VNFLWYGSCAVSSVGTVWHADKRPRAPLSSWSAITEVAVTCLVALWLDEQMAPHIKHHGFA